MVLVCPKCLKQWAHLDFQAVLRKGDREDCLWPIGAFCENCAITDKDSPPAGSILIYYGYGCNIDEALLDVLPTELLKREFKIHLRWAEKELGL